MGGTKRCFSIRQGDGAFPLGRFAMLAAIPSFAHGLSTRRGPDFGSAVDAPAHAAAALALASSCSLGEAAWMRQVHGGIVIEADAPGLLGEADALVTGRPGMALLARSADCPLILAAALDEKGGALAVGIAHASWRGTVARVTENMLAALLRLAEGGAGTAVAAIAPSAGPCCYEVGEDLREAALAGLGPKAAKFFTEIDGRPHFDLWRANVDQLLRAGVPESRIAVAEVCTICDDEHFYSYRRDGAGAGRFAAAIGIRGGSRSP
jgi:YfiH family protein